MNPGNAATPHDISPGAAPGRAALAMSVSLCIATFRRPQRLAALLCDLVAQELVPDEVVVVDNDALGSAGPVVEQRQALGAPFPIRYEIQPEQNIALTRNRTLALARGDWIGFIDDDERAPPQWLRLLVETAAVHAADAVLGPVEPLIPDSAPAWIRRGGFYRWARMPTGRVVPLNKLRLGNALLRAQLLRGNVLPFDPAYGLTGGEDGEMLGRLAQEGARIVWCDEAVVSEPVEPARLSLRWLLLRALRGGQDYARHRRSGRFGPLSRAGRWRFVLRAVLQAALAAVLALLSWPAGRHHAVHWLIKTAANLGKVSVFLGWHYREYRAKPA